MEILASCFLGPNYSRSLTPEDNDVERTTYISNNTTTTRLDAGPSVFCSFNCALRPVTNFCPPPPKKYLKLYN